MEKCSPPLLVTQIGMMETSFAREQITFNYVDITRCQFRLHLMSSSFFWHKSYTLKFSKILFYVYIFLQKEIGKKAAFEMLVKLSAGNDYLELFKSQTIK